MNNYNNISLCIYNSHMLMRVTITNNSHLPLLKLMKIISKLSKRLLRIKEMMNFNFKNKNNETIVFFENFDLNI